MSSSTSYGNKIYKKRKSPKPYIIMGLSLVVAFTLFYFMGQTNQSLSFETDENPQVEKPSPTKIEDDAEETPQQAPATVTPPQEMLSPPENKTQQQAPSQNTVIVDKSNLSAKASSPRVTSVLSQAAEYFQKKEYKKAVDLYRQVLPAEKSALVYSGLCYYYLEDYENAIDFFNQALAHNPLDFLALKFITFSYYNMDDLEKSREFAKKALDTMDDQELQELHTKLKEEEKVMEDFDVTEARKFKIFFSRQEHQEIERTVLDILKSAYREVGRKIDFYPKNPISVILYNEKDFFDVTRSPGWAGGLYDGKIRMPIKGLEGIDTDVLEYILYHEYVHALVHAITPQCPHWLNEGLAMYYSGGLNTEIGQVIPLEKLENGFPSGDEESTIAYIESFSAVSYLIKRYSVFRVKKLLEELSKGTDIKEAFQEALMISYDKFLKTWGKD